MGCGIIWVGESATPTCYHESHRDREMTPAQLEVHPAKEIGLVHLPAYHVKGAA